MKRPVLCLGTALILLCLVSLGDGVEKGEQAKSPHYTILLEPPRHIHAFREATLTFKVTTEDGKSITGLHPIIAYQFQRSNRVRETPEGNIVDNGGGT